MRIQPDQTPQPAPDVGIFNPKNPPLPRSNGKPTYAVVVYHQDLDQMVVYYSRDVDMHISVLHDNDMNASDADIKILDGGYIENGMYVSDQHSGFSRETSNADRSWIESRVNETYALQSESHPFKFIPDRGIFDPGEFPKKYLSWRIPAVKRSDGIIIWSSKALNHFKVLEDNRDLVEGENIIEGGIIENGVYTPSETSIFTRR